MTAKLIHLPDNTVDLWTYLVPQRIESALCDRCLSILSPVQRERHDQFRPLAKRQEYALSHAMERIILSRYVDRTPGDWNFVTGPLGRPAIDAAQNKTGIEFNLSHTEGLFALAVTRGGEVGIDVEMAERPIDLAIADRYFSAMEQEQLLALPANDRVRRFFELWTAKEAYLKARGAGLHLPLDGFSIEFQDNKAASITFDQTKIEDSTAHWQIYQTWLSPRHVLACVVGLSHEPTYRLRTFEWDESFTT